MPEMRQCKECGEMFMPKGREKYCSKVHYRPCPICGTPVVAKYLSDPPSKCANCKGKKMQPASAVSKPKSIFNIDDDKKEEKQTTEKPVEAASEIVEEESSVQQEINEKLQEGSAKPAQEEITKTIDPDEFCAALNDTIRRYIGPNMEGSYKFVNGHDYKILVDRKESCYMVSSTHDITAGKEVSCFGLYSSQISIRNRFIVMK